MLIRPLSDLRCEFLWDKLVISIRIHKTISPKDFATGSSCFVKQQEAAWFDFRVSGASYITTL